MRNNQKCHRKKTNREQISKRVSLSFLTPSLAGVFLFFVMPCFVVVYYALISDPVQHHFVWLDNFQKLLHNPSFLLAAKNTAIFSCVCVPAAVIISLIMACILSQNLSGASYFRTALLSPLMVPAASVVLIWQVVFSYNGAFNDLIKILGGNPVDWMRSDYGRYVVILLFLWKNIGYNMILFIAALANVPKTVLEMAMIEGAGSLRIFFQFKLRYISPTIVFVTILSLINSMKIFREVYLLTGHYPYDSLYLLQHFMNNMFERLDYQKLSAAAICIAFVMLIVILFLFISDNRLGKDLEE